MIQHVRVLIKLKDGAKARTSGAFSPICFFQVWEAPQPPLCVALPSNSAHQEITVKSHFSCIQRSLI